MVRNVTAPHWRLKMYMYDWGTTMKATNHDGHMEDYDGQIHNGHNHDCTKSKPTARPTGCTQ